MSEEIFDDKKIPQTTTAFDVAAGPQFASDEDDLPVEIIPQNGRTTGRYARQGVCHSTYGC